jgi:hypothetical protein
MSKCNWGAPECTEEGTWRIGIRVYALGVPKVNKNSLTMFSSVCVCEKHKPQVKVEDFTLPEGKERIQSALMAMGRRLLDFTTAELYWTRNDSDEIPENVRDVLKKEKD